MNKVNFDKLMQDVIAKNGDTRPTLLLHACCAPCASACLERLKDFFKITVFFYNPNIEDDEYFKRKNEMTRLLNETGWADELEYMHEPAAFYGAIGGHENDAEGGERCVKCFTLRLERTAEMAMLHGFDYFATTLTLSPLKDETKLNEVGYAMAERYNIKWLPSDFKKRDGYLRSLQLSEKYNLYRQNYCGCIYSKGSQV